MTEIKNLKHVQVDEKWTYQNVWIIEIRYLVLVN